MALKLHSRICVSIGAATPGRLLAAASDEAARGERFFEFCLEFLDDPYVGPAVIREFHSRCADALVLATCRREGGQFRGSIARQLALLDDCFQAGAGGVDLEIETAEVAPAWMMAQANHLRIVSYHGAAATAEGREWDRIFERLERVPADIHKLAVHTEDPRAVLSLLAAAAGRRAPAIVIAMGRAGMASRIVGPVAGRSFTYAAPRSGGGTAPGQLRADELRTTYDLDALAAGTAFCAGFSRPTDHAAATPGLYRGLMSGTAKPLAYFEWRGSTPPQSPDASGLIQGVGLAPSYWRWGFQAARSHEWSAASSGMVDTLWRDGDSWRGAWELGAVALDRVESLAEEGTPVAVAGPHGEALRRILRQAGYPQLAAASTSGKLAIRVQAGGTEVDLATPDVTAAVVRRQVERWAA